MGFTVDTSNTGNQSNPTNGKPLNSRGYPRDSKDNKFFKEIQVKNIKDIITDDCVVYLDSDTIAFKAAQVQEEAYVTVTNMSTGWTKDFKTKTEFKGAARKEGKITDKSWLGIENMKRVASGEEAYTLDMFTIEPKKRLKPDGGIDGIKSYIDEYSEAIKFQFEIDDVQWELGSGDVFRHALPLPEPYKGNRNEEDRPMLLSESREYIVGNFRHNVTSGAETGLETDDLCSIRAYEGYIHYRKTGKFNKVQLAVDKDSWQVPSLSGNYDMNGIFFKQPQTYLIEATDKGGLGTIEFVSDQAKCSGMMQVCKQMLTGDSSDHYHPYLRFPKEMQPEGSYADTSFFKDFCNLKTPLEGLQKVVDVMHSFFPYGLKYTDCHGVDQDVDTMHWCNTLFLCVYMKRKMNDTMDFYKLCNAFKVDTSKITGNNKLSAPVPVFIDNEEAEQKVLELKTILTEQIQPELKSYKSLKKNELVERLDNINTKVDNMRQQIETFYTMKQLEK